MSRENAPASASPAIAPEVKDVFVLSRASFDVGEDVRSAGPNALERVLELSTPEGGSSLGEDGLGAEDRGTLDVDEVASEVVVMPLVGGCGTLGVGERAGEAEEDEGEETVEV